MKIVSFNVNGIRARIHQLEHLIDTHSPDIIGLQEIKVEDGLFPEKEIRDLGYHVEKFGQKGHYGVALLHRLNSENDSQKVTLQSVIKGFPEDSETEQKRWIQADYEVNGKIIKVANGYFPQGENRSHAEKFPNKKRFYEKTYEFLDSLSSETNLIVMGDMNISHQDIDIGIGERNKKRWLQTGKCSFLPEEREWLQKLMDWGLKDTYRMHHPEDDSTFSWFDYRSRGFDDDPKRGLRIDLILASSAFSQYCKDSGIALDIRAMSKPSDHSPIWAQFDFS